MVIDNGLPHGYFADAITTAAPYIDVVKFGWGTSVVTDDLDRKLDVLRANDVRFSFGGTLFEKFVVQDAFDSYLELCRQYRADLVEVSNGTIPMSNTTKAAYIRKCADEFTVFSEVGFKDPQQSERMSPSQWIDCIAEDMEAGASMVITEARESGRSGICSADGQLRWALIEDILASPIDASRLLFEAPTKALQTHFITRLGPDVNMGNVAPGDVIALETLRLGLRGDTLLYFEEPSHARPR
jgi:phosphosulfolactate synthase